MDSGLSLNLNVTDWWRIHLDGGVSLTGSTVIGYGGGTKLFVPTWNVTPAIGIAWSKTSGDSNNIDVGTLLGSNFNYQTGDSFLSTSAGFDFIFKSGWSFSLGIHRSLDSAYGHRLGLKIGFFL